MNYICEIVFLAQNIFLNMFRSENLRDWGLFAFTGVLTIYTYRLWSSGRESSERQLRAYICVSGPEKNQGPSSVIEYAKYKITNAGKTPAYKVRILEKLFWDVDGEKLSKNEFPMPGPQILGPNSVLEREMWALGNSNGTLRLEGTVTYEDAFGGNRFTSFRFEWSSLEERYIASPNGNNGN